MLVRLRLSQWVGSDQINPHYLAGLRQYILPNGQLSILPKPPLPNTRKRCFVSPLMELATCTPLTRCCHLCPSWLENVTS